MWKSERERYDWCASVRIHHNWINHCRNWAGWKQSQQIKSQKHLLKVRYNRYWYRCEIQQSQTIDVLSLDSHIIWFSVCVEVRVRLQGRSETLLLNFVNQCDLVCMICIFEILFKCSHWIKYLLTHPVATVIVSFSLTQFFFFVFSLFSFSHSILFAIQSIDESVGETDELCSVPANWITKCINIQTHLRCAPMAYWNKWFNMWNRV